MNNVRLHGLSILRIISMFGIIGLHVMNAGCAFDKTTLMTLSQLPISIFYILCSSSVNIFAMLSGYLYVDKHTVKYKNILKLIFIVFFYSVSITIFFWIFKRDVFSSPLDIIKAICPPLAGDLWYVTCYVLLFVLIPFINKLINSLTINQFKILIILLMLFTSVLPVFLLEDFFYLNQGYSTAWLIVCYLTGAYIKRLNKKTSVFKLSLICLLCVCAVMLFAAVVWIVFGKIDVYNFLTLYISPFMVIISIVSIMIFAKFKLKNRVIIKIITSLSNSSFDAYILHCHALIFGMLISNNFVFIRNLHPVFKLPTILVSIIAIYLISWLISQIRSFGFKITRIDKVFDKLGTRLDSLLNKN